MPIQRPFVGGIAGPTCAGKTSLAQGVSDHLHELSVTVITLDSYYRDLTALPSDMADHANFDHPDSLDAQLLIQQITQIAAGRTIEKPVYRFLSHMRARVGIAVAPTEVILVEGLYALYWQQMREVMHLKVFIDAADGLCLKRRLERDPTERGLTPEFVRTQYATTVKPMFERFVLPTRRFADIVLNGEQAMEKIIEELEREICGRMPVVAD